MTVPAVPIDSTPLWILRLDWRAFVTAELVHEATPDGPRARAVAFFTRLGDGIDLTAGPTILPSEGFEALGSFVGTLDEAIAWADTLRAHVLARGFIDATGFITPVVLTVPDVEK